MIRNAAIFTGLVGAALALNGFGIAGAVFMFAALAVIVLLDGSERSAPLFFRGEMDADPEEEIQPALDFDEDDAQHLASSYEAKLRFDAEHPQNGGN